MDYNTFYLKLENKINYLNSLAKHAETFPAKQKLNMLAQIAEKKEVAINKELKDNNIPKYLHEEYKDNLFADDEFAYLLQA